VRLAAPRARALDIGCGAGRSTAALEPLARSVVGLEPAQAMLTHRRTVAPRAAFVAASAERLPFASGAFDIVTAAGSLNHVELGTFLPDLARGISEAGIRKWCESSLAGLLADTPRDVLFEAYLTCVRRRCPAISSSSSSPA
jgi:SAM-dependent methyltransferase